jgi:hypothetical protein
VWTAVFEGDLRAGDQVPDRARHEYLVSSSIRGDARADVDSDAAGLAVDQLALPGVQTGAYLQSELTQALADRTRAKKPSPAVSISRPRKRPSSRRTTS